MQATWVDAGMLVYSGLLRNQRPFVTMRLVIACKVLTLEVSLGGFSESRACGV